MSMAHILTREHGGVPGWGSHWGSPRPSETAHNRPHPSLNTALQESWSHLSSLPALGIMEPAPCPGSTVELTLVAGVRVSWPQECKCGELSLSLVCCDVAQGSGMISLHPLPHLTVRKPTHRVIISDLQHSGELILCLSWTT